MQAGQLAVSTVTLVAFTVGARETGRTDTRVTSVVVVTARCTVLTWSMRRTEVEICRSTTRRPCQIQFTTLNAVTKPCLNLHTSSEHWLKRYVTLFASLVVPGTSTGTCNKVLVGKKKIFLCC